MNYNWQSAAPPQGRERLEELEKQQLICRIFIAHDDRCEICEMTADKILEWEPSEFEPEMQFLDPDYSNEIAALKAENEQLLKTCQDSAAKEVVDKVLHERQVSELLATIDHLKKLLK